MAILYKNRFDSGLGDYTLVQLGSTITIVSGEMQLHETDTSNNVWNRIRATLTSATTAASGQVCYLQFRIPDLSLSEDMMMCTFADTNVSDFTNTDSARATGNVVVLYDDNVGNVGSFAESQNTTYDLKMSLNGSLQMSLSIRASNSVGNLPAGTGSYTSIGTSTTAVPATYHLQHNLKTLNPNTDLYIDEVYITNDGLFSPQVPTLLTSGATASTTILLKFVDNGTAISETGIKVERSTTSGSGFSQIGTAAQGSTTYTDSTASSGTTYYYRIRSYITISGTDYNSAYTSETVSSTPANTAPVVDAGGDQTVLLTDGADLDGDATDDGATLTAKDSSTCTSFTGWTKVEGVGSVTLVGGRFYFLPPSGGASNNNLATYRTAQVTGAAGDVIRFNWQVGASDQDTLFISVTDVAQGAFDGTANRVSITIGGGGAGPIIGQRALGASSFIYPDSVTRNASPSVIYNGQFIINSNGSISIDVKESSETSYHHLGTCDATFDFKVPLYFHVLAYRDVSETGLWFDDYIWGYNAGLTYAWTKISGPGTVTFDDDTDPTTHADFSASGTYVLRLTANDGEATGHDDVQIIVSATTSSTGPDSLMLDILE